MTRLDLTGNRYGRLTPVKCVGHYRDGGGRFRVQWKCLCDCGKYKVINGEALRSGFTKSCGCLRVDVSSTVNKTHGATTEGKRPREYTAWARMKHRCYNPKSPKFGIYGGRGIRVCKRWLNSYPNFISDLGECPPGLTLDRIDVNGNYTPSNCRWATPRQQSNNRRNNRFIKFKGMVKTLAQWADEVGVGQSTIWHRLRRGLSLARAFSTSDFRSA